MPKPERACRLLDRCKIDEWRILAIVPERCQHNGNVLGGTGCQPDLVPLGRITGSDWVGLDELALQFRSHEMIQCKRSGTQNTILETDRYPAVPTSREAAALILVRPAI